jgi:hypothetical protein
MPKECQEFFDVPLDQRGSLISTYPLDKQLRINRCGLDRRPPDRYLTRYIAENGSVAIPFLLEKLESEKDELSQYGIVEIFEAMSAKGFLRNREDAISRIRSVVSRMKISALREMAQADLAEIEKNGRD